MLVKAETVTLEPYTHSNIFSIVLSLHRKSSHQQYYFKPNPRLQGHQFCCLLWWHMNHHTCSY